MFTHQAPAMCRLKNYHASARLGHDPDMQQTSAFTEDGVFNYSQDSSVPR